MNIYIKTALLIATLSNQVQSYEFSIIAGLHISHYGNTKYVDYNSEPTFDSFVIESEGLRYDSYTYKYAKYNQGTFENNQLIGFRIEHGNFSYTLLTYNNSFFERSHGFCINRIFKLSQNVSIELGPMYVTGYRPAIIEADINKSFKQSPRIIPVASISYRVAKSINMTYTTMARNAGVTGIELEF